MHSSECCHYFLICIIEIQIVYAQKVAENVKSGEDGLVCFASTFSVFHFSQLILSDPGRHPNYSAADVLEQDGPFFSSSRVGITKNNTTQF